MSKLFEKFCSLHPCDEDLRPQDVEWMLDVTDLKPFLEWFLDYPDGSNCLKQGEIEEFADWCRGGNERKGDDLDKALAQLKVDPSKYLTMNLSQFDLELIDKEIEELQIQDGVLSDVENLLSDEYGRSLKNEQSLEKKLRETQRECQKEGQNLMKINSLLKTTFVDLNHSLMKLISTLKDSDCPDSESCFMSSMPLESLIYQCEKFKEYTNLFLKRNLDQGISLNEKKSVAEIMSFLNQDASDNSSTSSMQLIPNNLPSKLLKVNVNKIKMHGALVGYDAAIKHIQNMQGKIAVGNYNPLTMKIESKKILDDISRLSDDIDLILKHEAADQATEIVHSQIAEVALKITKARIDRRRVTLRKLSFVANLLNKFLYLTDSMWMLFMLESQRVKVSGELLREVSNMLERQMSDHKASMSSLCTVSQDFKSWSCSLSNAQSLLAGTIQRLHSLNISNDDSVDSATPKSMAELESRQKELESLVLLDTFILHRDAYAHWERFSMKLFGELCNGPTKKPILLKRDLSFNIQDILSQFEEKKKEFDRISDDFSVKQLTYKQSPAARNRRLLWAWFLVAPNELEEALRSCRK